MKSTALESYLEKGLLVFMILVAAGGFFFVVCEPFREMIRPTHHCLLHETTGLLCPACGGTRAMMYLLRCDLLMAIRYNPLMVALLPVFLYALTRLTKIVLARNRSLAQIQLSPFWAWSLLALVIIFLIARNIPYFNYLWYPW